MPPQFIPSKKIIITGSLLAIFIGWLFWVPTTDTFKLKNLELGKKLQSNTITQTPATAIDSDNDGLKDWEEVLWHTDPHNPDTDLDGTPDGEEIITNRNPTISGPDDKLQSASELASANAHAEFKTGDNLTEYIAQQFLTNYFDLEKQGANTTSLLPELVAQKMFLAPLGNEILSSDIMIVKDSSKGKIRSYLNAAATVMIKNYPNPAANEINILNNAIKTKKYDQLSSLSTNIAAYEKTVEELKTLAVPLILAPDHLKIINSYNNARRADIMMQENAEKDPAMALNGGTYYLNAAKKLWEAAADMLKIAASHNVNLSTTEPGYLFVKIAKP